MKILATLKVILLVFFLSLISCTPTQRPLKNGQGYVVVPAGENHYRIEYYLKHAETYWNTTAGRLCPGGFLKSELLGLSFKPQAEEDIGKVALR